MHASAPDLYVSRVKGVPVCLPRRGLLVRPCAALHLGIRDTMESDGINWNLVGKSIHLGPRLHSILTYPQTRHYMW